MALIHLLVDDSYIQEFVDSFDREKIRIVEKDYEKNKADFHNLYENYKNSQDRFSIYYNGASNILKSDIYDFQLNNILNMISSLDKNASKQFESYLNTIIMNARTKLAKYKNSVYFEADDVKDIEFQGCCIPFIVDSLTDKIVLLGISAKS